MTSSAPRMPPRTGAAMGLMTSAPGPVAQTHGRSHGAAGLWSAPLGFFDFRRRARLAFSADGRTLASGASDIKLWNVAIGQRVATLPEPAQCLAFSPDGKMLAFVSASDANVIKVWRLPN